MPAELFDTLLPVGLAVAGLLIFLSYKAKGPLKKMLMVFGGLALVLSGFDFITATANIGLSLLLVVAGVGIVFYGFIQE